MEEVSSSLLRGLRVIDPRTSHLIQDHGNISEVHSVWLVVDLTRVGL